MGRDNKRANRTRPGVSARQQDANTKPGSYEAQRRLAAKEADEQETAAQKGKLPELERVYRMTRGAVFHAVELAKMTRSKPPPTPQAFVAHQTRLAEFEERIKAITSWREIMRFWPTEPGITFSWKAGTSAMDVALQFAEMINTAALFARHEIATPQGTSLDRLPVEPKPHARFKKWCDDTIRELREVTIPPEQCWPTMGEIHRDSDSLYLKLRDEHARAVKAASGPWHPCDEGIIPIAEALERFAAADPLQLPKRLGAVSSRHSYELMGVFSFPGLGSHSKSAGRREMVRRWLQTNGLAEDSKEMDGRIHHFQERLRSFEQWACEVMASRADACRDMERRGEVVELIDRFGEPVRERWDEIQDEAGDLADYLRQLAVTIRAKIEARSAIPPSHAILSAQPTHSEDFTSVDWFGTRYTFSKGNQSRSIEVLWNAWEKGRHSLMQETIGAKIESSSSNFVLSKVFRIQVKHKGKTHYEPHPAWGTMIRSSGKGVYSLVAPDKK